ncbi:MAG: ABC transporter permease [Desulfobacteraceae bacterium]|jgi:putative ABC transport system permease protein
MLKNYFTIAINNLIKNKLYSAINIIGLAVGLTACLLITLYVRDELSYDKGWEKADLICRVNNIMSSGNSPKQTFPMTSMPALAALKKYFLEEIKFGTRIMGLSNGVIEIKDKQYPALVPKVDKEFPKIFQCDVLRGSLEKTLQIPGNIALSEELAVKYFGNKNPIGEAITHIPEYGDKKEYIVTAVYRFISPNTILNISCFSLIDEVYYSFMADDWNMSSPETYIRLTETASIEKIVGRLPEFVDQVIPGDPPPGKKMSDIRGYSLQKITDIYFNPIEFLLQTKAGNRTVIAVFIIISIVVLFLGCINFIILSTAKATQRAREVAMRKVVGARFKQLLIQFLGESVLITLLSFLLAIAFTELAWPFFELMVDKKLIVPYSSVSSYLFVLPSLMFVGLLGGFYPALILSRLSPARVLKDNKTTEEKGSFKVRNVLVVFQFTASIVLIIATMVTYFQLLYTGKQDPGFNPDKLLIVGDIGGQDISENKKITLQQELLKLPLVNNVALSTLQPGLGWGVHMESDLRRKAAESTTEKRFNNIFVDYNFFNTYEISLLSGRFFTQGMDREAPGPFSRITQSEDDRIIINSEAARQLGYASADEAIGKIVEGWDDPDTPSYFEFTIIGVVGDSQFRDLRVRPAPEIYRLSPGAAHFLTIRYKGDYPAVVKEVKRVWSTVIGDFPVKISSVKQNLSTTFSQEEQENRVLIAFALLAIFIACMGLFGIAAVTVDRRVKEIGVRKVMGAKVKDIVKLLGWQFLKPVFIANIIAWPVAMLAMQNWLERFPYRFNRLYMIPICIVSGFIALAIAWFTVAGNTKRVAKSKPIKALRYE